MVEALSGMNDLVRPAMYDSFHEIVPLHRDSSRRALTADVVGPICETGDFLARDRELPAEDLASGLVDIDFRHDRDAGAIPLGISHAASGHLGAGLVAARRGPRLPP